jgi:hypothetical protein
LFLRNIGSIVLTKCRYEYPTKIDSIERRNIVSARNNPVAGFCEHGNEPSGSIEGRNFLVI